MDDLTLLRWRLAEAIAWCLPRAQANDPEHSLRSAALRPAVVLDERGDWLWKGHERVLRLYRHLGDDYLKVMTALRRLGAEDIWAREAQAAEVERQAAVVRLAEQRAALLRQDGAYPAMPATSLAGGRLLVYFPDTTLSDGYPEGQSDGLVDLEGCPAWDTWVWYTIDETRVLLREPVFTRMRQSFYTHHYCWIPPQLLSFAEAGVEASLGGSGDGCLQWADDMDSVLTRQLRALGLLGA